MEMSPNTEKWIEEQLERIPSKYSFRIGEVAQMLSIKPYILRYWESEFDQLKPKKLDNKQRLYFHKDIKILFLIKKLLYNDGYSIRGAKQVLKSWFSELKQVEQKIGSRKSVTEEVDILLGRVSELISVVENQ